MADNISKYNAKRRAEQALVVAERLQEDATNAIAEARTALKRLDRPQSPGDGHYSINVQFDRRGATYTFLMLIHNEIVYTTAVKDGGQFRSFGQFIDWLEGKEPFWTSDILNLVADDVAVVVNL